MRQYCRTRLTPLGLPTGQDFPKSNLLCQENLTKPPFSLENRNTYIKLSKMGKIDKGAALGTMMLGALATNPAVAEEPKAKVINAAANVSQQVDCKLLARNHEGSGQEKMKVFNDCRNGNLDAQIAEKDKTLAEKKAALAQKKAALAEKQKFLQGLNQKLKHFNSQIDENHRVLDKQGQEIGRIVAINGRLVLERQQLTTQAEETFDRIEAYLRDNS